jgi:hypothetical protein
VRGAIFLSQAQHLWRRATHSPSTSGLVVDKVLQTSSKRSTFHFAPTVQRGLSPSLSQAHLISTSAASQLSAGPEPSGAGAKTSLEPSANSAASGTAPGAAAPPSAGAITAAAAGAAPQGLAAAPTIAKVLGFAGGRSAFPPHACRLQAVRSPLGHHPALSLLQQRQPSQVLPVATCNLHACPGMWTEIPGW